MDAFVFYLAGLVAVAASILVVTRRNPVYSAIFLVLFFIMVSVQFLVLRAPFLAVIQLLVYAGAIMVLFLFVLMLLNLTPEECREEVSRSRKLAALGGSAGLFVLLAAAIASSPTIRGVSGLTAPVTDAAVEKAGETASIAESLFRVHVLPFELTSFLIVVAIVGAIYLTKARGTVPEPGGEPPTGGLDDIPGSDEAGGPPRGTALASGGEGDAFPSQEEGPA